MNKIHIQQMIIEYLDYFSYKSIEFYFYDNSYYHKKANIIKQFFKKFMYDNFYDLTSQNRNGYLLNYKSVLINPERYIGFKIQFISTFQYSRNHIPEGQIEEGYLFYTNSNSYWIFVMDNQNIHPFLKEFIIIKSLRLIKPNLLSSV